MQYIKPEHDWDDLDIYDREAADIRRALHKIDLRQWCSDLKTLDFELYQKLIQHLKNVQ